MLNQEFIDVMDGKPWKNRSCGFDACDCWGLIALYYRHVLGVNIHHADDYECGREFLTCYQGEIVFWRQSAAPSDACMFVAYEGQHPKHVGLILGGQAFHSRGESGHVRLDKIRTLQKVYSKVEFYTYASYRDPESAGDAKRTA
ncbi:NlpC/P60 family protein [Rahnella inusitata]|uniref:NlpC/P60 family protein n=1 Tax=Rahnella inusitata TaxID=58169 RepID=UPI0039BE62AD